MAIRTGAWLLVVTSVLVGCSSETAPRTLPPVASQPAQASPTPRAPIPAEAQLKTPQAASAFARYFLQSVDGAFESADPSLIRRLAMPGCGGCASLAETVDKLARDGQRQVGGRYEDVQPVTPGFPGTDAFVDLTYRRGPSTIVDSDNKVLRKTPAVNQTQAQLRLVYGDSGWKVQGYRVFRS